jgi:hypothetical protein
MFLQFDVDNSNFDIPEKVSKYYILVDTNNNNDLSDDTPVELDGNNSINLTLST